MTSTPTYCQHPFYAQDNLLRSTDIPILVQFPQHKWHIMGLSAKVHQQEWQWLRPDQGPELGGTEHMNKDAQFLFNVYASHFILIYYHNNGSMIRIWNISHRFVCWRLDPQMEVPALCNDKLNPLKLWTQINLSSLKLFVQVFCHRNKSLIGTGGIKITDLLFWAFIFSFMKFQLSLQKGLQYIRLYLFFQWILVKLS